MTDFVNNWSNDICGVHQKFTIEQNAPSGRITTLRPKKLDPRPGGPIVLSHRAFHEIAVRYVEPFHSNISLLVKRLNRRGPSKS
jgi:hypothetical protein